MEYRPSRRNPYIYCVHRIILIKSQAITINPSYPKNYYEWVKTVLRAFAIHFKSYHVHLTQYVFLLSRSEIVNLTTIDVGSQFNFY